MPRGKSYSDDEKAACLAALKANGGNVARTARECGVPRATLQVWIKEQAALPKPADSIGTGSAPKKEASTAERVAARLPEMQQDLAVRFEALVDKMLTVADRKADELSAKDAIIAAGVAVDKMRLLRGESTQNISLRPDLSKLTDDDLEQLDRLAAVARGH